MAIEKFRFVSPGVQINEIDDSILPPAQPVIGPVVIGNAAKGPAMQPVQVSSIPELERVFGAPSNGNVGAVDVWRSGVPTSPTLATYAAKAFLANSSPITVIRLAGVPKIEGQTDPAGWSTDNKYILFGKSDEDLVPLANIYIATSSSISLSGSTETTPGQEVVSKVDNSATFLINSKEVKFTLDNKQNHFIRNVLNTNPSKYSDSSIGYFLGETYEYSTSSLPTFDEFLLLDTDSTVDVTSDTGATSARSGMVISGLTSGSNDQYTELFYFEGLNNGSSLSKDIKISIENVRASKNTNVTKYGTFDVVVRKLFETASDNVLERFSGVTLDPQSDNYILKRIGDSYRKWEPEQKRYQEFGTYSNKSAYVRVELSGQDIPPTALPCGFKMADHGGFTVTDHNPFQFPGIHLIESTKASSSKNKRFGLETVSGKTKYEDILDILVYNDSLTVDGGDIFNADFIKLDNDLYVYEQGVYHAENVLLTGKIAGFDMPLYGGFDAKNITVPEPFVNNTILAVGSGENDNQAYRAIKQAIEMVSEAEVIDMNTLCVPGLQNQELTDLMLEVCKLRGDAQAIIDLEGDYLYPYETEDGKGFRPTTVDIVTATLQDRAIDNSYGAAYFPAVFVPTEGLFLPASIAALGAIGGTEGRSALWFAPAGFNRGGLTELNSGINVSKTALHLVSSDRDSLYENNINPIATFPNEGVVIFGQKTLQSTPSALDRVNVRRLVNFIKKQISRAATRVLFEPNVENTWRSFKGVVDPFLLEIKNGYGIDDAKVVLDSTTTTSDLVDRNIMYCKIYIKPTRAIEYIGIDFVVTNAGAAFTE